MAITATSYQLLKQLRVKRGSSLLEIGEANWYGDLDPEEAGLARQENLFSVAREFYDSWFAPSRIVSVDNGGTDTALRRELNRPLELGERFDVVINNGTAEHIFDIAQVFLSMHDHCEAGGWMIHDAPFHGWVDHGFYCLQPTLFYDVALANCYEVNLMAIHQIKTRAIIRLDSRDHASRLSLANGLPMNWMLFVALRKRVDQPFVLPVQGYYSNRLSPEGKQAWETVR